MAKSFIARDTVGAVVGGVYYLVKIVPDREQSYYEIRDEAPLKNLSHEECVEGWLGSTNNVNRYAEGFVRVLGFGRDERSVRVVATVVEPA